MPRGNAYLGATMYFPEDNRYTTTRKELLAEIATTMGGQIAEKLTFGDITNGASGDIRQATNIARHMIRDWGMGDMGFVYYGGGDSEYAMKNEYSEEIGSQLDNEVRKIIDDQYKIATDILTEHQDQLKLLSETLLERETMSAKEVYELLGLQDMMEADEEEFDKKLKESLKDQKIGKETSSESIHETKDESDSSELSEPIEDSEVLVKDGDTEVDKEKLANSQEDAESVKFDWEDKSEKEK
jgi:cell division protease FtsH